jgi:hypothetical protein
MCNKVYTLSLTTFSGFLSDNVHHSLVCSERRPHFSPGCGPLAGEVGDREGGKGGRERTGGDGCVCQDSKKHTRPIFKGRV